MVPGVSSESPFRAYASVFFFLRQHRRAMSSTISWRSKKALPEQRFIQPYLTC
jgi:hypothetical protein